MTRTTPGRTVTILSRYARKGASSRMRTMLFMPEMVRQGLHPDLHPLFDDAYLDRLYSGAPKGRSALQALLRRFGDLSRARQSDLLWIEKEALPWLPWMVERMLLPRGVPYVVDYDDAVFHRYDLHRRAAVRAVLGRKLDHLMRGAALVTAGNAYLADRARAAGAPWVEIVPTVVDTAQYLPAFPAAQDAPVIGWIGSPSTWWEYVFPILPRLIDTATRSGARLLAVGAGAGTPPHPRIAFEDWTEETEVDHIRRMDIGIMPLIDSPWARGKCGYKLIQYMACGLPVVASPVGVNTQIIDHGVNGFLAESPAEWDDALARLAADPALRHRMGAAGRQKVERHYSLQVWGPILTGFLAKAAGGGHGSGHGGRSGGA